MWLDTYVCNVCGGDVLVDLPWGSSTAAVLIAFPGLQVPTDPSLDRSAIPDGDGTCKACGFATGGLLCDLCRAGGWEDEDVLDDDLVPDHWLLGACQGSAQQGE